jgi:hypothetical protein
MTQMLIDRLAARDGERHAVVVLSDTTLASPRSQRGTDTLEGTLGFYARVANMARAGQLRNGAPELSNIALTDSDLAAVAAFLRSLNEDYE